MKLGLFDMLGLAGSLVFALPLANFGAIRAMEGEVAFGGALVAVAVAMVVLPQYFFDPGRILRGLVLGLVPGPLRPGSGSGDADAEPDPEAGTAEK